MAKTDTNNTMIIYNCKIRLERAPMAFIMPIWGICCVSRPLNMVAIRIELKSSDNKPNVVKVLSNVEEIA